MARTGKLQIVCGQLSWRLVSRDVEVALTRLGGQLGPITHCRKGRKIQPLSVAPWATEKHRPKLIPLLQALRGDFFCMPFGGNETPFGREKHPPHGETANAAWKLETIHEDNGRHTLHASLNTRIRKGRVDKIVSLVDGHNAVYCRHVISGMSGPMNLGHHAMVKFPDEEGSGLISFSRFLCGQVFIAPTEDPAQRGYSCLKPGAVFKSPASVPTVCGTTADLTRYPARRGFEDIAQILTDPTLDLAWTAVSFPRQRYVWFALRDPKILSSTLMWMSNGGRHYAPWNGRHVNVMGLEDVTTYFHSGLAEAARRNPHNARGCRTVLDLKPNRPTIVNYIMAVALTPPGFDRVKAIDADFDRVTLQSESGKRVTVPIDMTFLHGTSQSD